MMDYSAMTSTGVPFFNTTGSLNRFDTAAGFTYTSGSGLLSTTLLQLSTASAGSPSLFFSGNPNTGLYWVGSDDIGISTGGTLKFDISTTAITSTLPYIGPVGLQTAPTIAFTGDTQTGMYQAGAGIIGFATTGTLRLSVNGTTSITSTLPYYAPNGSAGSPGYAFSATPASGIFRPSASMVGFSAAGTEVCRITSSQLMIFGNTASISTAGVAARVELHGTTGALSAMSIISWNTTGSVAAELVLGRVNSGTVGTYAAPVVGSITGRIVFCAADGAASNVDTIGASIVTTVAATVGANTVPSAIAINTMTTGGTLTQAMYITQEQVTIIGSSTTTQTATGSVSVSPPLQIQGMTSGGSGPASVGIYAFSGGANNNPPRLMLARTRGSAFNNPVAVLSGDLLGSIDFIGSTGADFTRTGASIFSTARATASGSFVASSMTIQTSTASATNTAMYIDENQVVVVGNSASPAPTTGSVAIVPQFEIQGATATDSGVASMGLYAYAITANNNPARLLFARSTGATIGSYANTANGDLLGAIAFAGCFGSSSNFARSGVNIIATATATATNTVQQAMMTVQTAAVTAGLTNAMTITDTQKIIVSTATAVQAIGANTSPAVQVQGVTTTNSDPASIGLYSYSASGASGNPARLTLGRSNNATIGTNTGLVINSPIGYIDFAGTTSGGAFTAVAARITTTAEASSAAAGVPTTLGVWVGGGGAGTLMQCFRIGSDGVSRFSNADASFTTTNATTVHIQTASAGAISASASAGAISAFASDPALMVENSINTGIGIITGSAQTARISMGPPSAPDAVYIERTASGGSNIAISAVGAATFTSTTNAITAAASTTITLQTNGSTGFQVDALQKIFVKGTGGNPVAGTATLSGGTVTVNTTAVTATSRISVSYNTISAVAPGFLATATRVNGTSFTITSTGTIDNSTVDWIIINTL
jgi:hypothetical protein